MGKFTEEEIIKIIKEWAQEKAKQGEIEYDNSFCGGLIVRYKTFPMTSLIPNNPDGKKSGFHRTDHYAYEIECRKTMLNLRLAFSYTNISDKTKQICDELLDKFKMMPKHDITHSDNFQRLCIFSDVNIKECKEEKEIWETMNKLFYQMKGYETFIIYKMQESDQSVQKEYKKPLKNNTPTKEDYTRYKEDLQEKAKSDKKCWVCGELEFLREFKVEGDYNTVLQQVKRLNSLYKTRLSNDECKKLADFIYYSDIFHSRILTNDRDVAASLVMELAAKEISGRSNLSFASKYCHHCNPNMYPIFDSVNEQYLKDHYSYKGKRDYRKYIDVYALFCQDIGVNLSIAEDKEEGFWVDKFINQIDKNAK